MTTAPTTNTDQWKAGSKVFLNRAVQTQASIKGTMPLWGLRVLGSLCEDPVPLPPKDSTTNRRNVRESEVEK